MTGFRPGVPAPDEVTAPWWEATGQHRLVLQTCPRCSAVQHPPRALCTHCGSDEPGWAESEGRGAVDSFTVVHRAPRPDLDVPYVIARVRLDEGAILLTRLQGRAPDDWRLDDPVRVAWVDLDDGRALPVFVPDAPSPHDTEKGS
ncbi:Zn-ribbon domain-containing OB-fold protein [Actinomadura sp. WMMA1423]|uniref:Zn-ribbon domain-containing OB-fold protein n=1 Tax=Actinomadura sp. WMMA1423 TaxID=2591108 RepID=UPI001147377B|nr:Zn-ribbon domain-containing OB-fold protein [Actinomadura sp. WMMA1423]